MRDAEESSRANHSNDRGGSPKDGGREPTLFRPRAERFPIQMPVRYRESGQSSWSEGVTINISRSGVLFRGGKELQPRTMIEMQMLLPAEVTGDIPTKVVCHGPVVRTDPPAIEDPRPATAASIVHYRFRRG